jgi:hypothetical protein
MIDEIKEEEVKKLISFLEEKNIPFERDIGEIKIKGEVTYTNLYYREIQIKTNNEKYIKVQYSDLLIIIAHCNQGKIVNIDSVILYEKGYLIIRY